MSESKHTRGPWTWGHHNYDSFYQWSISGADGIDVASIDSLHDAGKTPEQHEANAALIAAAPELLAACEAAIAWNNDKNGDGFGLQDFMQQIEAAIAKATNQNHAETSPGDSG
jgi:hypothetical protein